MGWFFAFFFVSGFCSILYEIVWLRLAMAQFGVTTALASIVLSMFMAGLGLGSWLGGRWVRQYERQVGAALRYYALAELLTGASALLVPIELRLGRSLLERAGLSATAAYYAGSGIWIALALIPWSACMGATIPVAMLAIRRRFAQEAAWSFSYLYLANVLGAFAGTVLPLLLIELGGFQATLRIGATLNGLLAGSAFLVSLPTASAEGSWSTKSETDEHPAGERKLLWLLFGTGLTGMGMEIAWIRQFTPYLGTVVYAFASLLGLYMLATFAGSCAYRRWGRKGTGEAQSVWALLGICALLPAVTADPGVHLWAGWRLLLGIAPVSAVLGFVTPMLVDRWSGGDPDRAGSAYALNIAGCILGPLVAGFVLLPRMGERWLLFVLALPWLGASFAPKWLGRSAELPERRTRMAAFAVAIMAVVLLFLSRDYDVYYGQHVVLRDNTATVVAAGRGMGKQLLVNGVGITVLTPATKMMAHLPLAFLGHAPRNALAICFGMGTTYRSLMSWGIPTTAVELVPSVPRLFGYYHADGPDLLRSPRSRLVVDDGRRFLERTAEQYDVITVDPPPPVEAAGSSLLYSKEFYEIAKDHLRPGGIFQQWLPPADAVVQAAVGGALKQSFPYLRAFQSPEEKGCHFLASRQPLPEMTAAELAERLPPRAREDLTEWDPEPNAIDDFALVLKTEFSVDQLIAGAPQAPALRDDRPLNEYYLLRRRLPARWQFLLWQ